MTKVCATDAYCTAEQALLECHGIKAQSRYVQLSHPRVRVRVLEAGAADGPPVLLVHGLGNVAASWVPLMARLEGFRLVAVDRPGNGLSDGFDFRDVDLRHHGVEMLTSLLDALCLERATIVGSSIGALMAMWLALDCRDRVERLVLFAPPLVLNAGAPLFIRLMGIRFLARRVFRSPSPASVDSAFRHMGHPSGALSAELTDLLMAAQGLPGFSSGFAGLAAAATSLVSKRVGLTAGEARRIEPPAFVVLGTNDTHVPRRVAVELASLMPNGSFEVAGVGHLPWLDDAARCADLVSEFVRPKAVSA